MYTSKMLEIFRKPQNAGGLQGSNGTGKYTDENTGDCVKIYLKFDKNNTITEARFKAIGSAAVIVASDAACCCLLDCTCDEALQINAERIYEVTGIFPEEYVSSINLVLLAIKDAVNNFHEREEKGLNDGKKMDREEMLIAQINKAKTSTKKENKIILDETKNDFSEKEEQVVKKEIKIEEQKTVEQSKTIQSEESIDTSSKPKSKARAAFDELFGL